VKRLGVVLVTAAAVLFGLVESASAAPPSPYTAEAAVKLDVLG